MTEQVALTDPVDHSVGGVKGHLFRRAFHLAMSAIPFVYFEYGEKISDIFGLEVSQFVSAATILLIVIEAIRLKLGFTIFGQRDYEAKQVSALAWGGIAIGLTLIALPDNPEFIWPLVLSLSLGDPFLGELRRKGIESRNVVIIGSIFIALIWLVSWNFVDTPILLVAIMGPICVAAEWPRLRWIDDNATMLLIPLFTVLLLVPWF
ncbi:MAG: hypothetical protein CMA91_06625 [Euryarchaeota archaeon]|jgi:hypothetical protein|nr:hypothetical protein [Euryarchaeota archaeon]|tara:strand:- start:514 stop:1131 length:618 start_codon:yes stop_codon:yes gene_type:complete